MRQRFPGFGFALSTSFVVLCSGCAAAAPGMKLAQPEMSGGAARADVAPPSAAVQTAESVPASSAPEMPAAPGNVGNGNVGNAPPAGAASSGVSSAPRREMLDIEAHVTLQVAKVKQAVRALHELSTRVGGVVTEERIDANSQYGSAELTLRVPSSSSDGVLAELERLGNVLDQNVNVREIGKEYFDANLRLSSLEVTQHRYEEILKQASKVEEILRIEQELSRVRQEIEQVKGNLRWLTDRAARATLHVTLRELVPQRPTQIAQAAEAEAKFFPGVRLPALVDFGKRDPEAYLGGGVSLRFTRAFSLDLDLLERPTSTEHGPDAIVASLGGEIYSDLLGGGERRFLNPYLGWRAGYARFGSDNQALLGATLGVELYKNRWFGLDTEVRNYLAFGGPRASHYLLTPALSARFAF